MRIIVNGNRGTAQVTLRPGEPPYCPLCHEYYNKTDHCRFIYTWPVCDHVACRTCFAECVRGCGQCAIEAREQLEIEDDEQSEEEAVAEENGQVNEDVEDEEVNVDVEDDEWQQNGFNQPNPEDVELEVGNEGLNGFVGEFQQHELYEEEEECPEEMEYEDESQEDIQDGEEIEITEVKQEVFQEQEELLEDLEDEEDNQVETGEQEENQEEEESQEDKEESQNLVEPDSPKPSTSAGLRTRRGSIRVAAALQRKKAAAQKKVKVERRVLRRRSQNSNMENGSARFNYKDSGAKVSKDTYPGHLRTQHQKERPHQCRNCFWSFSSSRRLEIHMKTHQIGRKKLSNVKALPTVAKQRRAIVSTSRPILAKSVTGSCMRCMHCGKRVYGKIAMASHVRQRHKKERPYWCTECMWCFNTLSRLLSHQKSHKRMINNENALLPQGQERKSGRPKKVRKVRGPNIQHRPVRRIPPQDASPVIKNPIDVSSNTCNICVPNLTFLKRSSIDRHVLLKHENLLKDFKKIRVSGRCPLCEKDYGKGEYSSHKKIEYVQCGHSACLQCIVYKEELVCGQCSSQNIATTTAIASTSTPPRTRRRTVSATVPEVQKNEPLENGLAEVKIEVDEAVHMEKGGQYICQICTTNNHFRTYATFDNHLKKHHRILIVRVDKKPPGTKMTAEDYCQECQTQYETGKYTHKAINLACQHISCLACLMKEGDMGCRRCALGNALPTTSPVKVEAVSKSSMRMRLRSGSSTSSSSQVLPAPVIKPLKKVQKMEPPVIKPLKKVRKMEPPVIKPLKKVRKVGRPVTKPLKKVEKVGRPVTKPLKKVEKVGRLVTRSTRQQARQSVARSMRLRRRRVVKKPLKRHNGTAPKTGNIHVKCYYCHKLCNGTAARSHHIQMRHAHQLKLQCDLCGYKCNSNLNRHMMRRHPDHGK